VFSELELGFVCFQENSFAKPAKKHHLLLRSTALRPSNKSAVLYLTIFQKAQGAQI